MKRPRHLHFIRQLPCLVCGDDVSVEAAHVREPDPRIGKPLTGLGTKPDDLWTVPLCGRHHRAQHLTAERLFWDGLGVDAILISLALWAATGDIFQGHQICARTLATILTKESTDGTQPKPVSVL